MKKCEYILDYFVRGEWVDAPCDSIYVVAECENCGSLCKSCVKEDCFGSPHVLLRKPVASVGITEIPNRIVSTGGVVVSDNLQDRGAQDCSRISLEQEHEVRYWTEELGVSREQLRNLVEKHGNSAAKIREALNKAA